MHIPDVPVLVDDVKEGKDWVGVGILFSFFPEILASDITPKKLRLFIKRLPIMVLIFRPNGAGGMEKGPVLWLVHIPDTVGVKSLTYQIGEKGGEIMCVCVSGGETKYWNGQR